MGAWSDLIDAKRSELSQVLVPDVAGVLFPALNSNNSAIVGFLVKGGFFPLPDENTLADMPLEIMELHMEINIVSPEKKYKLMTKPTQVISAIPSYNLTDYWKELNPDPQDGISPPAPDDGDPGVGIQSIVENPDTSITITLTDNSTFTTSPLKGDPGVQPTFLRKAEQFGQASPTSTSGRRGILDLGSTYTQKKLHIRIFADVGSDNVNFVTIDVRNSSNTDVNTGALVGSFNLDSDTLQVRKGTDIISEPTNRYLVMYLSGAPTVAFYGMIVNEMN